MLQKRLLDAHIIWRRSGPTFVFPLPKTHGTFIDIERRRKVLLRHAGKRTRSAQLPTGDEISASMIHQPKASAAAPRRAGGQSWQTRVHPGAAADGGFSRDARRRGGARRDPARRDQLRRGQATRHRQPGPAKLDLWC